ncbi:MAG: FtsX-like permease family protein [Suipraeoptans sp.]
MLSKLSIRNAKRQIGDYMIYCTTVIISVALLYAFNGLMFSDEIKNLSSYLEMLPVISVLVSIVVVLIIGWLISYTTRFMLLKRSREFGTYILLGMENKQVAKLFFLENLVVGGIAALIGIVLGNIVLQALRAITLSLFHVTYKFTLAFSFRSIVLTLFYFVIIYIFALRKSNKKLKKIKVYDLIYMDKQNENTTIEKAKNRRIMFSISLILAVIGMVLLLMRTLLTGIIGATCLIIFLFLFFISFSSGIPHYFDKHPGKKYKGTNLMVFRNLSSKLSTMGVVMAIISILFAATLLAEGSGQVFHSLFQSRIKQITSFDLFLSSDTSKDTMNKSLDYIETNIPTNQIYDYQIYYNDSDYFTKLTNDNKGYAVTYNSDTLMAYSDYCALRKMLGYKDVELNPNSYIIHCMPYVKNLMLKKEKTIEVGGHSLNPQDNIQTESFTQSSGWSGNGENFILVVPDDVIKNQQVADYMYAIDTQASVSEKTYKGLEDLVYNNGNEDSEDVGLLSHDQIAREYSSSYAMVVFPLYYLALILTMVAVTILTIQLLSETKRYKKQYQLLSYMGMDLQEIKRGVRKQFFIFYTMPLIPSLIISIPFILSLCGAVDAETFTELGQVVIIIGTTLALFFAIYLIYVFIAYKNFKRSIVPDF